MSGCFLFQNKQGANIFILGKDLKIGASRSAFHWLILAYIGQYKMPACLFCLKQAT